MAKNKSSAQESLTKTGLDITGGLSFERKPSLVVEKKEDVTPVKAAEIEHSPNVNKDKIERDAEEVSSVVSEKQKPNKAKANDSLTDFVSKKEKRTEREMFLLTPSAASWLKTTAKKSGRSKNDIINILIDNARKGQ